MKMCGACVSFGIFQLQREDIFGILSFISCTKVEFVDKKCYIVEI